MSSSSLMSLLALLTALLAGAAAECDTNKIAECSELVQPGGTKDEICASAGRYLDCLDKVFSDPTCDVYNISVKTAADSMKVYLQLQGCSGLLNDSATGCNTLKYSECTNMMVQSGTKDEVCASANRATDCMLKLVRSNPACDDASGTVQNMLINSKVYFKEHGCSGADCLRPYTLFYLGLCWMLKMLFKL